MDYHVVDARHVSGYTVWLRFRDGVAGEIDLSAALQGKMFEAVRDPAMFALFDSPGVPHAGVAERSRSGARISA